MSNKINHDGFKSRKFLIVALTLAASTIALFTGSLDGGQFATVASVCVGAYAAANAAEKSQWAK